MSNWIWIGLLFVLLGALIFLQDYNIKALEKSGVHVSKAVKRIRWVNVALMLGVIAYALWATLK